MAPYTKPESPAKPAFPAVTYDTAEKTPHVFAGMQTKRHSYWGIDLLTESQDGRKETHSGELLKRYSAGNESRQRLLSEKRPLKHQRV